MSDVAIEIKAVKETRRRPLLNSTGVQIRRLLGYHHSLKDFLGRGEPAQAHARTQGLRERADVHDQSVLVQCGQRLESLAGVSKLAIRIIFENRNAVSDGKLNQL